MSGSGGSGSPTRRERAKDAVMRNRREILVGGGVLGAGALGFGLGTNWGGDGKDEEENPEETITIDGYENDDGFDTHERYINQQMGNLSDFQSEYESIDGELAIDELISDGDDVRVGRDGSVSLDSNEMELTDGELPDPDYLLSQTNEDTLRRRVDPDEDGNLLEQVFTTFGGEAVDVDVDSVIEEFGFNIEEDVQAARDAAEEAADYNVLASTHLFSEQPTARPEAVRNLKESVDSTLEDLTGLYHEVKDVSAQLQQYEVGLKGAITEAESQADSNDTIKHYERAKQLRDDTVDAGDQYADLTTDVAADVARLAVVSEMLGGAAERAENIYENSELSEIYQEVSTDLDLDGKKEDRVGIRIGSVRNWSDIDDEVSGEGNEFEYMANRIDTSAQDMLYVMEGETGYFVNPDNGEWIETSFEDDREVYSNIEDGVWDTNQQA